MMLCKRCHHKLSSTKVKYCTFCGKKKPIPNQEVSFVLYFLSIFMIIIISIIFLATIYFSGIFGNFITYSDYNSEKALSISYPINWEYEEEPSNNIAVAFRPPKSNITNSHEAGLSITVENLYSIIPLNKSKENIALNNLPLKINNRSLQNDLENYTLVVQIPWNLTLDEYSKHRINIIKANYSNIEYKRTLLAGSDAFNITYTFLKPNISSQETEYKILQIWTIKNDKAYTITFMTEKPRFLQYFPIINKMINSFKIL